MKTCKDCNQEKSIEIFKYRKDRNYYEPRCKPCESIYRRKYRENNIETFKTKDKIYYENHKDQHNEKSASYYQNKKEKIKTQRQHFREQNKDQILERERKRYQKNKQDPKFVLTQSIRRRLSKVLVENRQNTISKIHY
jgi:hypothetical protein